MYGGTQPFKFQPPLGKSQLETYNLMNPRLKFKRTFQEPYSLNDVYKYQEPIPDFNSKKGEVYQSYNQEFDRLKGTTGLFKNQTFQDHNQGYQSS